MVLSIIHQPVSIGLERREIDIPVPAQEKESREPPDKDQEDKNFLPWEGRPILKALVHIPQF